MSVRVKDIVAITYLLLDNPDPEELSYPVVFEQYGQIASKMKYERVLGNKNPEFYKSTLSFTDEQTGIVTNTLTNFENSQVIYMEFQNNEINEVPASALEREAEHDRQAVGFYKDSSDSTLKAQLSIPTIGDLKIWYESITPVDVRENASIEVKESLMYALATRLASACVSYVRYKDDTKNQNKGSLARDLFKQSEEWKEIYIEVSNRFGTSKPPQKTPFMAR